MLAKKKECNILKHCLLVTRNGGLSRYNFTLKASINVFRNSNESFKNKFSAGTHSLPVGFDHSGFRRPTETTKIQGYYYRQWLVIVDGIKYKTGP